MERDVLGQHAVAGSAKRRLAGGGKPSTIEPTLEKLTDDTVAGFDTRDPITDRDDFSRAVRQWHDLLAARNGIITPQDHDVASIDGRRMNTDQHFLRTRLTHDRVFNEL
jgi:hypothetical protein